MDDRLPTGGTDDAQRQMLFQANRKSVGVAYLLWLVLAPFGVHRFYAGHTRSGVIQLVLLFSIIGWLVLVPWLLLDLILIPGLVRETNLKTIMELSPPQQTGAVRPEQKRQPRPMSEADRKRQAMLEDLRATGYKRERRDPTNLYR